MKRNEIKTLVDLTVYIKESEVKHCPFMYRINKDIICIDQDTFYKDVMHAGAVISSMTESNSRVAMLGENSYSYIVCYFASVACGRIPVMLDKLIEEDVFEESINETEASVILYSKEYAELVNSAGILAKCFTDVVSEQPELMLTELAKPDENDVATIFLTSGSTGKPKIVPITHKNIVSEFWSLDPNIELKGTGILCIPLHHAYGLVCNVLYGMSIDATIFITDSMRNFVVDIQMIKPDILVLVPLIYFMLMRLLKGNYTPEALRALVGPNLKQVIFGGAPFTVDPSLMLAAGITPYVGFGLTETAACITLRKYTKPVSDLDNVGKPIGNIDVKIGEKNEILVKGDMIFNGYYKNDKANEKAFEDGYFRTRDIGFIDENGDIHITGRIKNLIILPNGENVPGEKLEACMYKLPYVKECIVKEHEGRITAFVYSEEADYAKAMISEDLKKINAKLPVNYNITNYIFRDDPFPKTSSQKIKRY